MIALKILIVLICSFLFWWGGHSWNVARRYFMPLLLTATSFLLTHFEIYSLIMICSIGFLTLGYGEKSPLRHVFGNGWGRGIWGLLVGLALSLPLFLTAHIQWYLFVAYIVLSFTLENALKDIDQMIGDPIIGMTFGSIIFLIH